MADRFDEMLSDKDGKTTKACPQCGSRNITQNTGVDMGICKLGPNWMRCEECDYLFIRNQDDQNS